MLFYFNNKYYILKYVMYNVNKVINYNFCF